MEHFIEREHKFSHIYESNTTTFHNQKHMTYEYDVKQPTQMIILNLKMKIDGNPHLINALDRRVNHRLISKSSYNPNS